MYKLTDQEEQKLENSFTYHSPKPDQIPRYEELRKDALEFVLKTLPKIPPGRERALFITNIEQAVMWANKGIACNEV